MHDPQRAIQEIDGEVVDLAAPEGTEEYERALDAVMRAGGAAATTETAGPSMAPDLAESE